MFLILFINKLISILVSGCHIFYTFTKVAFLCVASLLYMMSKSFYFYSAALYY